MADWFHDDVTVEFLDDDDPVPVDPGLHVPTEDTEYYGAPSTSFEGSFSFDIGAGDLDFASLMDEQVAAELERIEYAIRGAILAGYDGVDVHRGHYSRTHDIVPWEGEPPEPPRGVETERYCWPWFDEGELAEIAATGEVPQALLATDD